MPFVAKWPGRIPRGTVKEAAVMNIDLYPTLLSFAGVGLPDDRIVDGKNISGILTGKTEKSPHDALYFYHYDRLEGVSDGRWKYINKMNRYVWPIALDSAPIPDKMGKGQMGNRWPLLYDIKLDPGESYNVINTHPDIADKLKKKMDAFKKEMDTNARGFIKKG